MVRHDGSVGILLCGNLRHCRHPPTIKTTLRAVAGLLQSSPAAGVQITQSGCDAACQVCTPVHEVGPLGQCSSNGGSSKLANCVHSAHHHDELPRNSKQLTYSIASIIGKSEGVELANKQGVVAVDQG